MKYDTIEFLKDGKSLGKTCVPEWSDDKVRIALAKHINAYPYDEMWFHRIYGNGRIDKVKLTELITG